MDSTLRNISMAWHTGKKMSYHLRPWFVYLPFEMPNKFSLNYKTASVSMCVICVWCVCA